MGNFKDIEKNLAVQGIALGKMAKQHGLTLGGIKWHKGHDGQPGLNANLLLNGKRIATIYDDAMGGGIEWRFNDDGDQQRIIGLAKIAVDEVTPGAWPCDALDAMVNALLEDEERRKMIRKWSKTSTVFRLIGDAEGVYKRINAPYSPRVAEFLAKTHGTKIEMIWDQNGMEVAR